MLGVSPERVEESFGCGTQCFTELVARLVSAACAGRLLSGSLHSVYLYVPMSRHSPPQRRGVEQEKCLQPDLPELENVPDEHEPAERGDVAHR